jgi:hypothetical protein
MFCPVPRGVATAPRLPKHDMTRPFSKVIIYHVGARLHDTHRTRHRRYLACTPTPYAHRVALSGLPRQRVRASSPVAVACCFRYGARHAARQPTRLLAATWYGGSDMPPSGLRAGGLWSGHGECCKQAVSPPRLCQCEQQSRHERRAFGDKHGKERGTTHSPSPLL